MMDYLAYILLFMVALISVILEIAHLKPNQLKVIKAFFLIFLTLFVGLRYNTGADWYMYIDAFYKMPTQGNIIHWEYGFYVLSLAFHFVFGNYYVMQFAASAFLIYALNKVYSSYSGYPIFSTVVFVMMFFQSIVMCQVRQSLAVGIILLSVPYILDRKLVPFLLMVLAASLFHVSACVTIVLYFMTGKWNKVLCIVAVIIGQFLFLHTSVILSLLQMIAPIFPERLETLIYGYMNTYFIGKTEYNTGLYYLLSVLLGLFTLVVVKPQTKENQLFYNSLVVSLLIISVGNGISIINRFLSYFYAFGMISIISLISIKFKGITLTSSRFLISVFLIMYFALPNVQALRSTKIWEVTNRPANYGYIPYYNVLHHPAEADKRLDWYQKSK